MARPYFTGDYGAHLARVDTRPIIEAGKAQGQIYAQMGKDIGGMIKEYGLNKEKRDKAEAAFQGDFGRVMQDPEQLASMQADPVIGPTLKRIQEGKGTTSDFDKYNAYRASAKQAELDTLRTEQIKLEGIAKTLLNENSRMRNELDKDTMGSRKRIIKGQADVTEAAGDYAYEKEQAGLAGLQTRTAATAQGIQQGEEIFPLQVENLKSQIRSRDLFTAKALYDSMGIGGTVPPDLEKRFSEISTLLDKNDSSLIKVRTDGGLFGSGEETTVTFAEYKENPDDYAPLTSTRINTLQANEERLIKEQTNAMLNTKIPARDTETGEVIYITLEEKMKYDANKQAQNEIEQQAKRDQEIRLQEGEYNQYMSSPIRTELQGVRN